MIGPDPLGENIFDLDFWCIRKHKKVLFHAEIYPGQRHVITL